MKFQLANVFANPENVRMLIAISTVLVVFVTMLVRRNAPTEILFSLALLVFVVTGVTSPERAWQAYSDPAVIAIAGLLIVSGALRTSGALDLVGRQLLGGVRTEKGAMARLSGVLIVGSAFLLNTAIVAMLLPLVISWCRRLNIAPSRLLLPISYLAILGGTCTLVGTSTNFVINGTLRDMSSDVSRYLAADGNIQAAGLSRTAGERLAKYDRDWLRNSYADSAFRPMVLTDISWVGVPCAISGALFLLLFGRRLLPDRSEMLDSLEEKRREYLVEMTVTGECPLIGKTVEEGGLRHLPGLFLIEIDRDGEVIGPVAPTDRIRQHDRLVFTGVVATIVDLEKIPGLVPAADINYEISTGQSAPRSLVEVVLSPTSPLVGSTIRQANFRQHYGAAVVAVHRNGERLPSKIGDIELLPGDTLLLQTQQGFVRTFRNRPDFYLVSGVEDGDSRRPNKLRLAGVVTGLMMLWLLLMPAMPQFFALDPLTLPAVVNIPAVVILVGAMVMLLTRCISVAEARRSMDWPLLLTVGAALGVGRALSDCGAADLISSWIVGSIGTSPTVALVVIFAVTVVFTEMISNVAVAAMMFFVAVGVASQLGVSPRPFIMAVTLAASLSFISPIGYQTNLMVMGPGGYRPADYVRAGLPLSIFVGILALVLIPLIWPF